MPKNPINSPYPEDWTELANAVKEKAGWRCIKCHHPHEGAWKSFDLPNPNKCDDLCTHPQDEKQRVLTVHHLDINPANRAWWNLAALCQACHLEVQGRFILGQYFMLCPPEWLAPYVEGWRVSTVAA